MWPDKREQFFVSDMDKSEIPAGKVYRLTVEHPDGTTQRLEISAENYRNLKLEGLGAVEAPASHRLPTREKIAEDWDEDIEDQDDEEDEDGEDENEDIDGSEHPVPAPWSPGKWYEPRLSAGVDWELKQAPHGPQRRQVKQYRAAIRRHYGLETAIRYIDAGRAAAFVLGLQQETPELWTAAHDVVIKRNGRVDLETVALVVDALDTQRHWSLQHTIAVGSRIGGAAYRLRKLT